MAGRLRSGLKENWRNGVVCVAALSALACGFIGVEVGFRIYKNTCGLEFHPVDVLVRETVFSRNKNFLESRRSKDKTFKSRYVNTNKEGFRSQSFDEKDYGLLRIVVLGGSAVWGYNVSDQHTISAYLESHFRGHNKGVEVFNLGLNSSTIGEQTGYLYKFFDRIEPDIIILYCGANEFGLFEETARSGNSIMKKIAGQLGKSYTFRLLTAFAGKLKGEKQTLAGGEKLKIQEAVQSFRHAHRRYEDFCAGHHLQCFTFFQPYIFHKKEKTFYEAMVSWEVLYKTPSIGFYDYFIEGIIKSFKNEKATNNHMIDMRDVFLNDKSSIYADYVHVNNVGNRLLAKRMYDEIMEEVGYGGN